MVPGPANFKPPSSLIPFQNVSVPLLVIVCLAESNSIVNGLAPLLSPMVTAPAPGLTVNWLEFASTYRVCWPKLPTSEVVPVLLKVIAPTVPPVSRAVTLPLTAPALNVAVSLPPGGPPLRRAARRRPPVVRVVPRIGAGAGVPVIRVLRCGGRNRQREHNPKSRQRACARVYHAMHIQPLSIKAFTGLAATGACLWAGEWKQQPKKNELPQSLRSRFRFVRFRDRLLVETLDFFRRQGPREKAELADPRPKVSRRKPAIGDLTRTENKRRTAPNPRAPALPAILVMDHGAGAEIIDGRQMTPSTEIVPADYDTTFPRPVARWELARQLRPTRAEGRAAIGQDLPVALWEAIVKAVRHGDGASSWLRVRNVDPGGHRTRLETARNVRPARGRCGWRKPRQVCHGKGRWTILPPRCGRRACRPKRHDCEGRCGRSRRAESRSRPRGRNARISRR